MAHRCRLPFVPRHTPPRPVTRRGHAASNNRLPLVNLASEAAARRAVVEYISWHSGTRLHITLGYLRRLKRSVSGGPGRSKGEVEGLIEAERLALGVGALELLLGEGGTHLIEAVVTVARFGLLPAFSGPV